MIFFCIPGILEYIARCFCPLVLTVLILGRTACPRNVVRNDIGPYVRFHERFFDLAVDDVRLEFLFYLPVNPREVPTHRLPKLVDNGVWNIDARPEGQLIFTPDELVQVLTDSIAFK